MGQTSSGVPHHDINRVSKSSPGRRGRPTLARNLTGLWDEDAVLLQPGQTPKVGKAAFEEFVKQDFAKSPSAKVLKCTPDIRGLHVRGGVASEWGFFDSTYKPSEQAPPITLRARLVRVRKQPADGFWKFMRMIWAAE